MSKMDKFTEHTSCYLTPELKQRLRVAAAHKGLGQSDYIREVLEAHVPQLHPARSPLPHPNPQPMR